MLRVPMKKLFCLRFLTRFRYILRTNYDSFRFVWKKKTIRTNCDEWWNIHRPSCMIFQWLNEPRWHRNRRWKALPMYGLVPETETAISPSLSTVAMLKSVKWACPSSSNITFSGLTSLLEQTNNMLVPCSIKYLVDPFNPDLNISKCTRSILNRCVYLIT